MTKVRELYWVPRLRALVKQVLKSVFQAASVFRLHGTGNAASLDLLPTDRTEGSAPFEVIGVDFAGPIKYRIKAKNRRERPILHCTRAVLPEDYSWKYYQTWQTSEFLRSLKRLIARRGRPEEDIFRQWQNLCWRRKVAQTSYA